MKTKRRKLMIALALIFAICVGAFIWLQPFSSAQRINPYTAMKIRIGMTQGQVEAIFGVPPGNYSTALDADSPEVPVTRRPELRREDWMSDEGGAAVYFGPDGRVADCTLWVVPGRKMAARERVRKWWYWLTVW